MHDPGEDRYGYEQPEERWLPIHTVETIMVSVISMLADPNDESPANLDAAVSMLLLFVLCIEPVLCGILPPVATGRVGMMGSVCHTKWSDLLQIKTKMFLDGPFIASYIFNFER